MALVTNSAPLTLISLACTLMNHLIGIPGSVSAPVNSLPSETNQIVKIASLPLSSSPFEVTRTAVRDSVQAIHLTAVRSDSPYAVVATPFNSNIAIGGSSASEFDPNTVDAQELQLVSLINRERVAEGLNPVVPDPLLASVARSHSQDMCDRNYFDHLAPAPGPVTPMDRYLAAVPIRPGYAMVGENIYYRSNTDSIAAYATEAHIAFMNSPGHRANILTPAYTMVGVGIYRNPSTGEYWVTEMFATTTQP